MKSKNDVSSQQTKQPCIAEVISEIQRKNEGIIDFCTENTEKNFYCVEKSLRTQLYQLACLYLQLYLLSFQEIFDYSSYISSNKYYQGALIPRTLNTIFGEVRYWRTYFNRKQEVGGFYPYDAVIGLTKDGFSPLVMSFVAKLSTRMSFSTVVLLFKHIHEWSPSSEAIQGIVLGMGRESTHYMEQQQAPKDDGEILIIEVDGKATPTATSDELEKRRGKRNIENKSCCKRHQNKYKRQRCHQRGKNKRKNKSDKRKNGRSITLVVIYTLKKAQDGKLHGPLNKQVWGSYAPRKVMLAWARKQATKRGFPPNTSKRIHIAIDGEICLYDGLSQLFPKATFVLDIRHLEEKIWDIGRILHKKDSDELYAWIDDSIEMLYAGEAKELIVKLKKIKLTLSARANRDKKKREKITKLLAYMEKRTTMMNYKELIDEDMVIASGIVEGAARYVIGERMDCGGMRWIPERAEMLLKLRCIELNGDWNDFFNWGYQKWINQMNEEEKNMIIRKEDPEALDSIDLIIHYFETNDIENDGIQYAA